jgi:hypothetical protein
MMCNVRHYVMSQNGKRSCFERVRRHENIKLSSIVTSHLNSSTDAKVRHYGIHDWSGDSFSSLRPSSIGHLGAEIRPVKGSRTFCSPVKSNG